MAICNLQEKLLFYTRRKSSLTQSLDHIQNQYLTATRQNSADCMAFSQKLQEAYYDPDFGYGTDEYVDIITALNAEKEDKQAAIMAWESELDLQKQSLETQLSELQNYEQSWQNLLKQNISKDFTYGGGGGK